jgi:uncharacterized membrane protein YuzA (DUF378 family)
LRKTFSIIEFVAEAILMIVCGVAWAMAGFPHFKEVAIVVGAGFVCFGAYVGVMWTLNK